MNTHFAPPSTIRHRDPLNDSSDDDDSATQHKSQDRSSSDASHRSPRSVTPPAGVASAVVAPVSSPLPSAPPQLASTGGGPISPLGTQTQLVKTVDEGTALTKHIKRLETETVQLASSLAHICDENTRLADQLAALQTQLHEVAARPLADSSVLQKLFDKDQHSGWLSGGKSATKEKLQHTLEDLQNEYIAYRQSHVTNNEEVQALVQELQSAHTHSSGLAHMISDLQRQLQRGAPSVRVVVESPEAETRLRQVEEELKIARQEAAGERAAMQDMLQQYVAQAAHLQSSYLSAQEETIKYKINAQQLDEERRKWVSEREVLEKRLADTTARLDQALQGTASASSALSSELARARDEITSLRSQEQKLTESHKALELEVERLQELEVRLESLQDNTRLQVEIQRESNAAQWQERLAAAESAAVRRTTEELELAFSSRVAELERAHAETRQRSDALAQEQQKASSADIRLLQERLVAAQEVIAEYEAQLNKSISMQNFVSMEVECNRLRDEVALLRESQQSRDSSAAPVAREATSGSDDLLSDVQHGTLRGELLHSAQDEARRLKEALILSESERDDLLSQVAKLTDDLALQRQKHDLLLKKCATVTQEKSSMELRLGALANELTKQQVSSRSATPALSEENAALTEQVHALQSALAEEKQRSDSQISSLQTRLAAAQETIAQMDLINTQSQLTSAQLATVAAEAERLRDSAQPLHERIHELERQVKTLTATHDESARRVASQEQQISTLTEQLVSARRVSDTLQRQMDDMQFGVTQMAQELETERSAHRADRERWSAEQEKHAEQLLQAAKGSAATSSLDVSLVLRNELEILRSSLMESEKTVAELEERVAAVTAEKHDMETNFATELEKMMSSVAEERNALEAKHSQELAAAISAAATAAAASSGGPSRGDMVARRASSVPKEDYASLKAELEALQGKYQDVLNSKVRSEAAANKKISALEAQLATATRDADEKLKERCRAYDAELDQCHKHILSLREEMTKKRTAGGTLHHVQDGEDSESDRSSNASSSSAATKPTSASRSELRHLKKAIKEEYVSGKQYYSVKCENDKLLEDIKRQAANFKTREEEYKLTIVQLQQRLKASGSATPGKGGITMPSALASPTTSPQTSDSSLSVANQDVILRALRQANDALMKEKEDLLMHLGEAEKELATFRGAAITAPSAQSASHSLHSAQDDQRLIDALRAKNESLTVELMELKKSLSVRTELNNSAAVSFHAALDGSEEELRAAQEQIAALRRELDDLKRSAATTPVPLSVSGDAEAAEVKRSETVKSASGTGALKRKTKSNLPGSALLQQAAGDLAAAGTGRKTRGSSLLGRVAETSTGDVPLSDALAATSAFPAEDMDPRQHDRILQRVQEQLRSSSESLERLQKEHAAKVAENASLKDQLKTLLTEVKAAQADLDEMHAQHEEELAELRAQLVANQAKASSDGTPVASPNAPVVSVAATNALEKLRTLQLDFEALQEDNEEIKKQAEDAARRATAAESRAKAAEEAYATITATKAKGTAQDPIQTGDAVRSVTPASAGRSVSPPVASSATTSVAPLPTTVDALQKRVRALEEQLRQRDAAESELMRDTQQSALEMDRRVRQKQREVDEAYKETARLAKDLLPVKQRLAEYIAFADRLGVRYPLPETLEAPQRIRLQSAVRDDPPNEASLPARGGGAARRR